MKSHTPSGPLRSPLQRRPIRILGWIVVAVDLGLVGSLAAHYLWSNEILPLHPALFLTLVALVLLGIGWLAYTWGRDRSDFAAVKGTLESEAHLLASQIPASVWTTDRELRLTSVYGTLVPRLENPAARVPGRTVYDVLETRDETHPDIAAHLRALRGESASYERDAGDLVVAGRVEPLRDRKGHIVGCVGTAMDVSTWRWAESQVRRLAALVQSSEDAIVSTDLNGAVETWNSAAERLYGYSAAELLGRPISVLEPEERAGEAAAMRERLIRGEQALAYETIRRRRDGTVIEISTHLSPIRDELGKLVGVSAVVRDVTERRAAERQLRLLADSLANASDMISLTDAEDRFVYVNEAFLRAYGYVREEVLGQTPALLRQSDDVRSEILAATRQGGWNGDLVNRRKDGTEFPVSLSTTVIRDPEGRILGLLGVARDITERRRAADASKKAEEDYRTLAENSPDLIARFDTGLRHAYVNAAAARAGKLSASEYVGLTIAESGVPEPFAATWNERFGQVLKTGARLDVEDVFPTPEGIRYFHTRIIPERAPDGSVCSLLSVARDITERKRAEEEVARIASFPQLTPMPIVEVDAAGKISFMNPVAERLLPGLRAVSPDHPFVADAWTLVEERQGEGGGLRTREVEIGGRSYLQNMHALPDHSHVRIYASDITDRKRAEELRERLAAIVESSEDAIMGISLDAVIESWNAGAERLYGYRAEEVIGRPHSILVPPESADQVRDILEEVRRGHPEESYETVRVRKGGATVAVSVTASPIKDSTGSIVAISGIHRDITERKRAEEALLHLAAIVDSSNDAVFSTDTARLIRTWNAGAERLYGYTAAEALGKNIDTLVVPPDEQAAVDVVRECLERGASAVRYEGTRVRKDGSLVEIAGTASQMRDPSGVLVGYTAIVRDITERKRTEEALRQSETMFRLMAENATDIISRHAPDGTFLYVSPACRKLLGYDAEELVGRSPFEFIHPDDATATTPSREALRQPHSYSVTFRFRRKDGTYAWMETLGRAQFDQTTGAVTEISAVSRDVGERLQVEEQLVRQGKELRALARHLESVRDDEHVEMVRVIHDELGQALTALRLDLSWLGRKLPARSAALRRKLDEMTALTDGTIKASRRLVADLRPPILDDLGLVPALEWYLGTVEERTKVRARLDVAAEPLDVTGPAALTAYRIVQEALTNVARHAEAKHVTVRLGTRAGALLLEIADDGAGMGAGTAYSPRSFGIMGMRERALAHGGALEVGPSPGGGTIVRATIPLERHQAARGPA